MTKFIVAALGLGALATSAFAASDMTVDANGDGLVTMDEVQAAYPEVTAEQFSEMDANGDGALDDSEINAAKEGGLMPGDASSEG